MLNYISAELYKLRHQTFLYIFLLLAVAATLLMTLVWVWDFEYLLRSLSSAFLVGFYLIIFLDDLVCSASGRKGPLKNEVAFGLPRVRIYLGKLTAAALLSFALCAVLLFFCLGIGWALSPAVDLTALAAAFQSLGFRFAAVFPLWLGTLGIYHCLRMLLGSSDAIAGVFAAGLVCGQFLVLVQWETILGPVGSAMGGLIRALPFCYWSVVAVPEHFWALVPFWLNGLGWLAGTSTVGCLMFRKIEL